MKKGEGVNDKKVIYSYFNFSDTMDNHSLHRKTSYCSLLSMDHL